VSGSGPTVVGLFAGEAGGAARRPGEGPLERAKRAAGALSGLIPAPIWAEPVDEAFGRVRTEGAPDSPPDGTVRHNQQTPDE